ncbi:MAG: hypothetical protein AB2699_09135, partial [Candidatus Thiodiazotropha taylori]
MAITNAIVHRSSKSHCVKAGSLLSTKGLKPRLGLTLLENATLAQAAFSRIPWISVSESIT